MRLYAALVFFGLSLTTSYAAIGPSDFANPEDVQSVYNPQAPVGDPDNTENTGGAACQTDDDCATGETCMKHVEKNTYGICM